MKPIMKKFEDLYVAHSMDVYRFALWLAGDSSEAEDITSRTFIRAWVRRKRIRTETLKAYLLTIARNVFLEQRRKRRHHIALQDDYPDPAPEPGRIVESQFELGRIQMKLESLPEMDRTAFALRVHHELPYSEIARILGLSPSAAKVKVHRLRKKLMAEYLRTEDFSSWK